jgi:hypothetical protein
MPLGALGQYAAQFKSELLLPGGICNAAGELGDQVKQERTVPLWFWMDIVSASQVIPLSETVAALDWQGFVDHTGSDLPEVPEFSARNARLHGLFNMGWMQLDVPVLMQVFVVL